MAARFPTAPTTGLLAANLIIGRSMPPVVLINLFGTAFTAPLHDIAQHIVQSQAGRSLLADRLGGKAAVAVMPGQMIHMPGCEGLRGAAPTGRVFPLRFGRQAKEKPVLIHTGQPPGKIKGLTPGHALNGITAAQGEVGRVLSHHPLPLSLGHRVTAHPETGQGVFPARGSIRRAPGYPYELDAGNRLAPLLTRTIRLF